MTCHPSQSHGIEVRRELQCGSYLAGLCPNLADMLCFPEKTSMSVKRALAARWVWWDNNSCMASNWCSSSSLAQAGRIHPMKYAIIIPDGCADEPQESLGGKTPLQAAHLPNMDCIARTGVVGRSNNVPPGLTPASDVATLSLFGYDPLE